MPRSFNVRAGPISKWFRNWNRAKLVFKFRTSNASYVQLNISGSHSICNLNSSNCWKRKHGGKVADNNELS
jgi:hypothetical protein